MAARGLRDDAPEARGKFITVRFTFGEDLYIIGVDIFIVLVATVLVQIPKPLLKIR